MSSLFRFLRSRWPKLAKQVCSHFVGRAGLPARKSSARETRERSERWNTVGLGPLYKGCRGSLLLAQQSQRITLLSCQGENKAITNLPCYFPRVLRHTNTSLARRGCSAVPAMHPRACSRAHE